MLYNLLSNFVNIAPPGCLTNIFPAHCSYAQRFIVYIINNKCNKFGVTTATVINILGKFGLILLFTIP